MHATVTALMTRGLDSSTAEKIRAAGFTLQKLKQKPITELIHLGISEPVAKQILGEQRPPIPADILHQVLFANRFQCCICRNPNLSIIVHHIDDWAKSKNHNADNLAVLCQQHHDDAHATKKLTQNLDQKTVKNFKKKWEDEVKALDARAILDAMSLDYATWNYINEIRVFDLAFQFGIDPKKVNGFGHLVQLGVAQNNGLPSPVSDDGKYYMYQGEHILQRYFFVSEVLKLVIRMIPIINISDYLDKGTISTSIVSGDFIFVQGKHIFSPITSKKHGTGRGQICEGVRSTNGIEVKFVFDRWEATSSSAKSCWLTGTRDQGSLIHVKDISRDQKKLVVTGTALGICSNNGELKTREYAASLWESGVFRNPYAHLIEEHDFDGADTEELI